MSTGTTPASGMGQAHEFTRDRNEPRTTFSDCPVRSVILARALTLRSPQRHPSEPEPGVTTSERFRPGARLPRRSWRKRVVPGTACNDGVMPER